MLLGPAVTPISWTQFESVSPVDQLKASPVVPAGKSNQPGEPGGELLHVGIPILHTRAKEFGGEAGKPRIERRGVGRAKSHDHIGAGLRPDFRREPETDHQNQQNGRSRFAHISVRFPARIAPTH